MSSFRLSSPHGKESHREVGSRYACTAREGFSFDFPLSHIHSTIQLVDPFASTSPELDFSFSACMIWYSILVLSDEVVHVLVA